MTHFVINISISLFETDQIHCHSHEKDTTKLTGNGTISTSKPTLTW